MSSQRMLAQQKIDAHHECLEHGVLPYKTACLRQDVHLSPICRLPQAR
jgi:hypothetical protein